MHERIEIIVSGRVQMVMYRDYAQRKGSALKLTGEVQNLPDGTVRVIAEGPRERLERYITKLRQGSLLSHVEEISVSWQPSKGAFNTFSIRYA